jgi:cytochrome P450
MEPDDSADPRRRSILAMEGEDHARLRRLVAPAFNPQAADRLRPFMREVVGGLLDGFHDPGRCELVFDRCEPYPIPIICELLGAPKEDWRQFSAWATDIFRIFNQNLAEDLLSDLIAVEEAGDRLSTEEFVSLAVAMLMAGTDTTRNQLASAMALFAEHPDQWPLLAERPEFAPRVLEEAMR